jgi:hypothetical protein
MANIGKTEPAFSAASVTVSDTARIDPTRGLYVGGAGNIKVDMQGGGTVTFFAAASSAILPISVTRVYSTGTTATNIIALY